MHFTGCGFHYLEQRSAECDRKRSCHRHDRDRRSISGQLFLKHCDERIVCCDGHSGVGGRNLVSCGSGGHHEPDPDRDRCGAFVPRNPWH